MSNNKKLYSVIFIIATLVVSIYNTNHNYIFGWYSQLMLCVAFLLYLFTEEKKENKKEEIKPYFKEVVIMTLDGMVIKYLYKFDNLPAQNEFINHEGKTYHVKSIIYDYDLYCIKIWVTNVKF